MLNAILAFLQQVKQRVFTNLDTTISSRSTQTSVDSVQADTNDIQSKIGSPSPDLASDIADVQSDTNDIQARLDVNPISTRLDTTVSSRATQTSVDTLNTKVDLNPISTRLDTTVSSRLADADAVTRVQTGLTNQGYTTTRAPYLDYLDAAVSSRMPKIGLVARAMSFIEGVSSWTDVVNMTGSGRLRGVHRHYEMPTSKSIYMQIVIDGITFMDDTTSTGGSPVNVDEDIKHASASDYTNTFQKITGTDNPAQNLDIFFKSSLVVKHRTIDTNTDEKSRITVSYERN